MKRVTDSAFPLCSNVVILSRDHQRNVLMEPSSQKKCRILIAVLESDPVRTVGFHALFDSESEAALLSRKRTGLSFAVRPA